MSTDPVRSKSGTLFQNAVAFQEGALVGSWAYFSWKLELHPMKIITDVWGSSSNFANGTGEKNRRTRKTTYCKYQLQVEL